MSNPEVKKLKARIQEYKDVHPEFRKSEALPFIKRKKMNTRKKLRGNELCPYCGKRLSTYTASTDHIVPLSRGGTNDRSNLVLCCKKCNREKGSKLLSEWFEYTDTLTDTVADTQEEE